MVGWASLSNVSSRSVYSGVTEISIYVHPRHRGRGIGDKLIIEMIIQSEQNEIWTIQAGIFPENISSINIHHKHDFRTVGIKERVGKMMIHGGT